MGSAASTLPDQLSEADLKNVCGENYNPVYYKALHGQDGHVARDFFISTSQGHEKEVFDLFLHFCPHGEMDSRTFVKMMKDTKSMKKNKFSATDADLIFSKHKTKQGAGTKALNYFVFRNDMVPEIIAKMGVDVEKYIEKLAKCDGPTLHGVTHASANRFHDDKSTYTGSHSQGGPSFENNSGAVQLSDHLNRGEADVRGVSLPDETTAKDEHHDAARKVQQVHRGKQAKKHVEALKEIKKAETEHAEIEHPTETEADEALKKVFMQFCPNGEMDSKTFIKMLKDSGVINRKFTSGDADLVFQKAKAKASNPGAGSYSSGVVHGKRVNYDVFRAVAVPCIAEKKGTTAANVAECLAKAGGPQLHGTTTADKVKFHDDQSTFTGTHSQPHQ